MRNTLFPKSKKVSISISSFEKGPSLKYDDDLTNYEYARDIENFSFDTGALKEGLGFDNLFTKIAKPDDIQSLTADLKGIGSLEKVFYFYKYNKTKNEREDKLIFISNTYEVYYVNLYDQNKQLIKLRNIIFSSTPVATRYRLNGEDVIIFSSETDNMIVWDGINEPYKVLDAPHISSMAVHFERLFATVDGEKNSIWFSDDLDPTSWSVSLEEAGFIEMIDERGALLKVVSFLDYIYIFREYGITRLSAFGDQTQFQVSNLYVSSGKIVPESVCVCGDKIIFLATDGLYKFDGVDTVKILENISNGFIGLDNQKAVSCFSNSSYYLACNFNETSGNNLNTLLEIDTEKYIIKNIVKGLEFKYIKSISTDNLNGVIAVVKDKSENAFSCGYIVKNGKYFNKSLKKIWKSQNITTPDNYTKKVLRRIYLSTKYPVKINIKSNEKTYEFSFDKSTNLQIKNCHIFLNDFKFEIVSESDFCDIKNLKFELYILERKL